MGSVCDEVFVWAISETISQWKSFQISVENGMGGKDAEEKLIWMSRVMADFFKLNHHLLCEEVVDFVAQIIDNEFNTIIEDGSLEMFASSVTKYHELCTSGREQEVRLKVESINRLNRSNQRDSDRSVNQSVVENGLQSLNIEDNNTDQQMDCNENNGESDGWTVVKRKH